MQRSPPSQSSASDVEAPASDVEVPAPHAAAPKEKRDSGVVETVGYSAAGAIASDEEGMFGGDGSFRTLGRWETAVVLFTNQVGLGILSLPNALRILGIVPGVIAIIGIGLLSTYTAYELLQYWRAHPHVLNLVDMAKVLGGRPLQIVVGVSFVLNFALTCASAGVTLSIALNTISEHAACTVLWIGLVMLVCWALCLPRTFKFVAKVGIPSTVSIVAAVLITTIGLGVTGPQGQPPGWEPEIVVAGNPTFRQGLSACLNIAYAYAGNSGFVSVFTEMRDPSRDFVPALTILQLASISLYVVIAIAIYCLAGDLVTSPALGSASVTVAKVAYGIALPALLATGVVFAHCAIKYMYVVALQAQHATHEATRNTRRSWATWVGCASAFWIVAFVLCNAIPAFSSILDVSSALFIAWFTFGISAVFYFDRLRTRKTWSRWDKGLLIPLNAVIICIALFMNGAGMWVAVVGLQEVFSQPGVEGPFTCADNSLF